MLEEPGCVDIWVRGLKVTVRGGRGAERDVELADAEPDPCLPSKGDASSILDDISSSTHTAGMGSDDTSELEKKQHEELSWIEHLIEDQV